jgi:hypothetical protein
VAGRTASGFISATSASISFGGDFDYLAGWARWAEHEAATWQDTAPSAAKPARALDVFAHPGAAER